jgi:hypothetical protein
VIRDAVGNDEILDRDGSPCSTRLGKSTQAAAPREPSF